ncbi:hypothetical protein EMGBS15_09200 [Filimonas sp.]|nr:hypothetical protein EMGBS15_09200 [Filimonas sp.]
MQLPFVTGQIFKRTSLHEAYGGNRQSGICPSTKFPYIFIFTGAQGGQHGYADTWENENVFSYTGEGQSGDMKYSRGNLALKDHLKNGKRVFLFKYVRSGYVEFVNELVLMDSDYFGTHDTSKSLRIGIKFFFKKVGAYVSYDLHSTDIAAEREDILYAPIITEKQGLVTSRVGQGAYRKSIINRWENKCAVTGFSDSRILIASHIVPWKEATDDERLDLHNGLLLSPTYDALFDRNLISFENSGKIILSDSISFEAYKKIGVDGKERIKSLSNSNMQYLQRHQTVFNNSLKSTL